MKSAAIILADGFEEIEALTTVDVLRRAGIRIDMFSLHGPASTGSHGITVTADSPLGENKLEEYDMLIFPGGMPGAANLRDDGRVLCLTQEFDKDPEKYVAALCAAPMVLAAAGITKGRRVTSYPSDNFRAFFTDAEYVEDELVVVDDHMITSRGPATAFLFAYTLVEILGGNSSVLREDMLINLVTAKISATDSKKPLQQCDHRAIAEEFVRHWHFRYIFFWRCVADSDGGIDADEVRDRRTLCIPPECVVFDGNRPAGVFFRGHLFSPADPDTHTLRLSYPKGHTGGWGDVTEYRYYTLTNGPASEDGETASEKDFPVFQSGL